MAKTSTKTTEKKPVLVKAFANSLRVSPRKMRLVTNLVKKMQVSQALVQLRFANKKAAPMLVKLIKSAVANAEHNFSLHPDTLYIKEITCDMGPVMKRSFPRARGSAFVIRKKLSNVNLVLESKGDKKLEVKKSKAVKAVETETEAPTDIDKGTGIKGKRIKTSEMVKENTVANKRRLFNRKSS